MGGDLTSHTPAHNLLLPLLPSGPGGVYRSLLRGDRLDHHSSLRMFAELSAASQEARIIITLYRQCKAEFLQQHKSLLRGISLKLALS